ncbi:MAG: four helix bundle protein [Elusimicrobia bacterium]|nr:four helix bundle protein [Elusimicrobiota bacterium]
MKEKYIYTFETLDVWKKSIKFAKKIYEITDKFPNNEKFGLVSQLRRAAVSVSSNLAEGSAKISLKEQAKFTEISIGSLFEILNQIIISYELNFINKDLYLKIRDELNNLNRQINALKLSQLKRYKTLSSKL